jgi:hypothetical protein
LLDATELHGLVSEQLNSWVVLAEKTGASASPLMVAMAGAVLVRFTGGFSPEYRRYSEILCFALLACGVVFAILNLAISSIKEWFKQPRATTLDSHAPSG